MANFLRTRVAPVVMPAINRIDAVRRYNFRTVSQILVNYRGGPLSRGTAGGVQGGDRLPWASSDRGDNFGSLAAMTWQVHVYGEAGADLQAWCARHDAPLHVFEWRPDHRAVGLARDAAYLLRPDTYVALADPSGSPTALDRYFADQGMRAGVNVV